MTTYRNAHVLRCPTRWADVDQNGHINNARLVGYIQEGIYDLFHHHARAVRDSLFSAGFLIARHEIDYLEQLHHGPDPLLVRLMVERLGRSSAQIRVDVCRGPFTYMTARTVVVARDRVSGRSRKLSQSERRFLSDYLTDIPSGGASGVSPAGGTAAGSATVPGRASVPAVVTAVLPTVLPPVGPVVPSPRPAVTPSVMARSKPLSGRSLPARQGAVRRGPGGQARKVPLPGRGPGRVLCEV
ncbi:acyl-CoA thioesterase FadM [Kitasatospora sp. GAS204A]|uniref:acyl-CoA thioesterase n=1 Tax=unclassified Kitasatospora TaxID=2633591 RepID=UPI002476C467|nr:thioesterase family protein [Kitasatospora sp. GAS204B]MDH6119028.1 acyl-CoA thioesterase FadM [Kitasatospora sp. GAS204B]